MFLATHLWPRKRPFHLDYALAGCPVVTRDGEEVTDVRHDPDAVKSVSVMLCGQEHEYQEKGVVSGLLDGERMQWFISGDYGHGPGPVSGMDLFLTQPPAFHRGDHVIVARKVTQAPDWDNDWLPEMDADVGVTGTVACVRQEVNDYELILEGQEAPGYSFPAEALQYAPLDASIEDTDRDALAQERDAYRDRFHALKHAVTQALASHEAGNTADALQHLADAVTRDASVPDL